MPVFVMFVGMYVCALVSVSVAWVCEDGVGAACVVFVCGVCVKRGNRFFFLCALVQFSVLKMFLGPGACVCALCRPARVRGGGVTT